MPVAPLEDWVRERSRWYDTAYVSSDPSFAHAHITLLGPLVAESELTPDVHDRVGAILARHAPFTVRLAEVDAFPNGTIHLRPEPAWPLHQLTTELAAAFPEHPPYRGEFDDIRPHLTLDRVGPDVDVDTVRAAVAHLVPAEIVVEEAQLSWYEPDRCHAVTHWQIGRP